MMDVGFVCQIAAFVAVVAASASGFCLSVELRFSLWRKKLRKRASQGWAGEKRRFAIDGLWAKVLGYMETMSRRLALGATERLLPGSFGEAWFADTVAKAGLRADISCEAFCECSLRLGLAGLAAGALFGAVFSFELMVVGGFIGAGWGALLPRTALRRQAEQRGLQLQRELPELLEVTALGLQSGLSFDRSFALYGEHFHTVFAAECASAQSSWSLGLTTREDALRDLSSTYDSVAFGRVVETIIRALRFGSSLGKELEQAAQEARATRRSNREEVAAKAPVKMMIPTGVFILPAMLLMVLGPVLLEMMNGF